MREIELSVTSGARKREGGRTAEVCPGRIAEVCQGRIASTLTPGLSTATFGRRSRARARRRHRRLRSREVTDSLRTAGQICVAFCVHVPAREARRSSLGRGPSSALLGVG
jgi:hypothetical protein